MRWYEVHEGWSQKGCLLGWLNVVLAQNVILSLFSNDGTEVLSRVWNKGSTEFFCHALGCIMKDHLLLGKKSLSFLWFCSNENVSLKCYWCAKLQWKYVYITLTFCHSFSMLFFLFFSSCHLIFLVSQYSTSVAFFSSLLLFNFICHTPFPFVTFLTSFLFTTYVCCFVLFLFGLMLLLFRIVVDFLVYLSISTCFPHLQTGWIKNLSSKWMNTSRLGLLKWQPVGQIQPADHTCLALCQLQNT